MMNILFFSDVAELTILIDPDFRGQKIFKKFLMIGHNQRLAPLHVKAKQLIADGVIGKIISFKASFSHPGPESCSD